MIKLGIFLALAAVGALGTSHDATMTEGSKGADVVERVCDRMHSACLFDDDKLFMRRTAFVETADGEAGDTFKQGYHGGIWKVDEDMFATTQEAAAQVALSVYLADIKTAFGIDWSKTTWNECRKPLVSALAARLYIQRQIEGTKNTFPRDIPGQATFWEKYYRTGGDKDQYEEGANKLNTQCKQIYGADLLFLLDGSGSVKKTHFNTMKKFVVDVIDTFDIAADATRVAVGTFAASYRTDFYLNTYFTKQSMINKINKIGYPEGGTRTDLALDRMVDQVFTTKRGSRDKASGIPRVAIILTDGQSNYPSKTIVSALKGHDADITMFAVGVGPKINLKELEAIASEPQCLHLMMLDGFEEVESLKYAISTRTCDAPVIVGPGKDGTEIEGKLPSGGDQNCKLKVPDDGTTVKIEAQKGQATFYLSSNTYPSSSFYDVKVVAVPNHPGVVFVPKPSNPDSEGIVFCNIKGDPTEDSDLEIGIIPGDEDHCRKQPCKNGAICVDEGSTYRCDCPPGFQGNLCEKPVTVDPCKPNPCQFGTCSNNNGNYVCTCQPGWKGKRCDEGLDKCSGMPCRHGNCTSFNDRYECCCEHGWTGKDCDSEINECASDPCVHGKCNDRTNGYVCVCDPGYIGHHCEIDDNECASDPCVNGDCEDKVNGYVCHCRPGWTGIRCDEDEDECKSDPCVNGLCKNEINHFWCDCDPGWIGPRCDIDRDDCLPNPCYHGATCLDKINNFQCLCASGWTGRFCNETVNECASNPCIHGDCKDDINRYDCICHPGFTGIHCEREINECESDPCLNGATCDDRINKYICICPDGFTGVHCETDINECQSNPCQNGAKCKDRVNGYECDCTPGWTGSNCDCMIDNCESSPCIHGRCTNKLNSYVCTCNMGYKGVNCDKADRTTTRRPITSPTTPAPVSGLYNCGNRNPCTEANRKLRRYHFGHVTPGLFVQCDDFGKCFEMPCPSGLVWSDSASTCTPP